MIEIAIASIIALTTLSGWYTAWRPKIIEAKTNAQLRLMKQREVENDRFHNQWQRMAEIEATSTPEVQLELAKVKVIEAERLRTMAETDRARAGAYEAEQQARKQQALNYSNEKGWNRKGGF